MRYAEIIADNNREVVLPMIENAINEYAGNMEIVFAIP